MLTALIEKYGVDVNCVVEEGWTTLLIDAALEGSTKCVAVLLSHGADVNLAAVCKGNPVSLLHVAAEYGHVAVCRQLVEAGADLEFRSVHQFTALHVAAKWGKVGVVALLMQRGADTCAMNVDLRIPIMVACQSNLASRQYPTAHRIKPVTKVRHQWRLHAPGIAHAVQLLQISRIGL